VQFRRTNPESFLFNMRNPEDALMDATASAIREVVGRNVLDFILTEGRAAVSADTQDLLQATLDSYGAGITVYEVNLVNANFPAEVEGSVQDSIKAREDRERRILQAEEYSNDILPRARGEAARRRQAAEAYRDAVVATAQGEADRFSQVLVEYQKAPGVTRERMYIETLEGIMRNSTKVLVNTEGGNNLLYLPLDQLVQRRPSTSSDSSPPAPSVAAPAATSPVPSSRMRDTR
jgi:membrane protease subunit HflK